MSIFMTLPYKLFFIFVSFGCTGSSLLHADLSPVVASRGYSPVTMHGLLITAASLVVERRLQACRLQ